VEAWSLVTQSVSSVVGGLWCFSRGMSNYFLSIFWVPISHLGPFIHTVVMSSSPSIPTTLSSCNAGSPHQTASFTLLSAPSHCHSDFYLCDFDYWALHSEIIRHFCVCDWHFTLYNVFQVHPCCSRSECPSIFFKLNNNSLLLNVETMLVYSAMGIGLSPHLRHTE
jgi:hypothetical protein